MTLMNEANTVAVLLFEAMKKEAEEMELTMSDYDIDSFSDNIDEFSFEVQRNIENLLSNYK